VNTYAVIVHTSRKVDGWERRSHSPIFFLDGDVQGIVSADHAARIAVHMAREIAGPDVQVWAHAWFADASGEPGSAGDDPMKELRK
jgi:hypothetical protein